MPLWWVEHGHKDRCGFFFETSVCVGSFSAEYFNCCWWLWSLKVLSCWYWWDRTCENSPLGKSVVLVCLLVCVWCCCFYASRHKQFCGFFSGKRERFSPKVYLAVVLGKWVFHVGWCFEFLLFVEWLLFILVYCLLILTYKFSILRIHPPGTNWIWFAVSLYCFQKVSLQKQDNLATTRHYQLFIPDFHQCWNPSPFITAAAPVITRKLFRNPAHLDNLPHSFASTDEWAPSVRSRSSGSVPIICNCPPINTNWGLQLLFPPLEPYSTLVNRTSGSGCN